MSHTVQIQTQFKKFDTLVKAFNKIGWTIKESSTARTYPSDPARHTVYPHIAVNPQTGYDVGITVSDKGEIGIHYDPYGGSVERTLGSKLSTLKKEYVMEVTREEFEDVQILEMLEDGSIILEADDGL